MAKRKLNTADKSEAKPATPDKGDRAAYSHELLMSSNLRNAAAMESFSAFSGKPDLGKLLESLHDEIAKVQGGDMKPIEAMLYGQAIALETMFTSLSRRAMSQEYLKQFNSYLALALKAQAQCRATLEALAEVKNPRPVAFVKQANISQGPQQVNNGTAQVAHAGKNGTEQNGLLPAPTAPALTPAPIEQEREHVGLDA